MGKRFRSWRISGLVAALALLAWLSRSAQAGDSDPSPEPPLTLSDQLKEKDDKKRWKLAHEIQPRLTPRDLPAVLNAARDGRLRVRVVGYWLLMYIVALHSQTPSCISDRVVRERIIPVIMEGLRDKNVKIRRGAIACVRTYARMSRELLDRVIELLDDKDIAVSEIAVGCLVFPASHPDRDRVRRILLERSKKGPVDVRNEALRALGATACWDPKFVPKVLPMLTATVKDFKLEVSTRGAAATGIRYIGPNAREAVEVLRQVIKQPSTPSAEGDSQLRRFMIATLLALGPTGVAATLPELIDVIQSDDVKRRNERESAFWTLQKLGPAASKAIPTLRKVLKNAEAAIKDKSMPRRRGIHGGDYARKVAEMAEDALRAIEKR